MKNNFKIIDALLILDKPVGISSNQALQKVKRLLNAKKAGHTGSLDVLASGLLPICFGEATKFSQFLLNADKKYFVKAIFGKRTTTCDAEGEIIEEKSTENLIEENIQTAIKKFIGLTKQIPSMYSALKHKGRPLYEFAREGIEIEREPRDIFVYEFELISFQKESATFMVHCSKGTYIRNLIDDLGKDLNVGAYVAELRRMQSGPFKQEQMVTLEQLKNINMPEKFLLPIESMFQNLPKIILTDEEIKKIYFGQAILTESTQEGFLALFNKTNNFIGIAKQTNNQLKSQRLMKQTQKD